MKSKEEFKNKGCMHWNCGSCKDSQWNHVYTDEDCYIHLKVQHMQRHTWTDRNRQGQTGPDKDKQGQVWTDMDK